MCSSADWVPLQNWHECTFQISCIAFLPQNERKPLSRNDTLFLLKLSVYIYVSPSPICLSYKLDIFKHRFNWSISPELSAWFWKSYNVHCSLFSIGWYFLFTQTFVRPILLHCAAGGHQRRWIKLCWPSNPYNDRPRLSRSLGLSYVCLLKDLFFWWLSDICSINCENQSQN